MSTIVAIDFGLKRVGVAISQALNEPNLAIPTPFDVWEHSESEAKLLELIKQRSIKTVVFGIPLNADGTESSISLKVRRFAKRISKRSNVSITFIDEFGSSIEAGELILESNMGGKRSRVSTDAHAASVILTRYISQLNQGTDE